jgi:hypothetical protein
VDGKSARLCFFPGQLNRKQQLAHSIPVLYPLFPSIFVFFFAVKKMENTAEIAGMIDMQTWLT